MKKLKTVFAAALMLFATSAFAIKGPEKVSAVVKAAFEKNFTGAIEVNWVKKEGFYFASFQLDAKDVEAAYDESGELVGISRVIKTTQLPLGVSVAIASKFIDYRLAPTATEITYDGQTNYYVLAENSKHVVKLNCNSNGGISIDSKIKK
jgi:hypothetical protein